MQEEKMMKIIAHGRAPVKRNMVSPQCIRRKYTGQAGQARNSTEIRREENCPRIERISTNEENP